QIVPERNEVVVGRREELLASELQASDVNWLCEPPAGPCECSAKIRYRHSAAPAVVTPLPGNVARVVFRQPQSAVTPGQAVVFYDSERVLGGGWIDSAGNGMTSAG